MKNQNGKNEQQNKIGTLLLSFAPVIASMILYMIAFFADIAIFTIIKTLSGDTYRTGSLEGEDALSVMTGSSFNAGLLNLIKFSLYLVIFGFWYYKSFCNTTKKEVRTFREKPVSTIFTPIYLTLFVILGYCVQLFVDAVLLLLSNVFPKTFAEYFSLADSLAGQGVSVLMIISVIFIAPIAEELIFRGLTFRYAIKIMPAWLAVSFQAVIFGIYHGNIVQGIYAFLIGLLFGLLVYKTDSLIPSVLLHCFINAGAYLVPSVLLNSNIKAAIILIAALVIGGSSFLVLAKAYRQCDSN